MHNVAVTTGRRGHRHRRPDHARRGRERLDHLHGHVPVTQADIDAGHFDNMADHNSAKSPVGGRRRRQLTQNAALSIVKTGVWVDGTTTASPMRRDDRLHLHGDERGNVTLHNVAVTTRSAGSPSPGGATTLEWARPTRPPSRACTRSRRPTLTPVTCQPGERRLRGSGPDRDHENVELPQNPALKS